jgi:hypothetical protein
MKQIGLLGLVVALILGLAAVKESVWAVTIPNIRIEPSSTPVVTINLTPTEEITPTESPTLTPTATIQPTTANPGGKDMTFWFLVVTIGLLAVIIVVQAWPKKTEEE